MSRQTRRSFTDEFKTQMVQLYLGGKKKSDIIREYELTPSSLDRWIQQHENIGSYRDKDNRSDEDNELIRLRKKNQCLKMENDILASSADHRTKVEVIEANRTFTRYQQCVTS